jgi:4-hydroxybenzoate polyprenyltransferase
MSDVTSVTRIKGISPVRSAREPLGPRTRTGSLLAYLRCIRYQDVLVLQGSPCLGAAFALGRPTVAAAARLAVFGVASILLVAHIFSLNDWAGAAADGNDRRKQAQTFLARGVTPGAVLALSLGLLAVSLSLFALLRGQTLLLAIAIAVLGALYSHPAFDAKGSPVLSSVPHLAGGTLHFLLGYSLFAAIDGRSLQIALYFALTFTAGHLNQEVRDHDGDLLNGIRTNAVRFGRSRAFWAGFAGFTAAYALLGWLAFRGLVPPVLGALLVLYPLHLYWTVTTWRAGLDFDMVSRFQARYRALYGVIGLAMLAALFLGDR